MPILKAFLYLRGQIYHMSMMQEGTYAHRAALWKNGLIFMFPVHRIMTKIYEVILQPYFYFSESSYQFVKYESCVVRIVKFRFISSHGYAKQLISTSHFYFI